MNYGESRKPQGICEGAAWLSSARAVRCRLKCHNERNPCCQLLTGSAEDSDKTAIVRCEEGGDDVKSARPLRPGLHTCYNGGYRGPLPREWMPIPKPLSVRTGVCNPTPQKGDPHNHPPPPAGAVNTFPGLVHTARQAMGAGGT